MSERLLYVAASAFEAARHVPVFAQGHRARRLHGHSFLAMVRTGLPPGWASFPGAEVGELRDRLARGVAPLNYQLLNDIVTPPTDEHLARWVRGQLTLPGVEQIGIQSTSHSGVDLDRSGQAHTWRRYGFESAHLLPNVPAGHKCGRMHGHGFEVILHAKGALGSTAMGLNHDHLDRCWAPIHAQFHHACLNDIPGLENPTSELISSWIWRRLKPELPELSWVTVYETATCGAHFDGRHYRIWKESTLDSAIRLERAPDGDPRRRIHGHTYTLRLHLNAPIDQVMGWTMDFGDVKQLFGPVFDTLDHRPLYEVAGIDDNDCANLLHWIKTQTLAELPRLDRIDLYETRGCGALFAWGDADPALPV